MSNPDNLSGWTMGTPPPPPGALSADQLQEIESMGALQFKPDEVATIVGATPEQQASQEFQTALQRGRLKEEALVRAKIFEHAKNGSSPAQVMAMDMILAARVDAAGE